jgi:hypothetical protein
MNTPWKFATLALAALLFGCAGGSMYSAYSEPYVAFVSEHRMGTQGVLPAIVRRIDGAAVVEGRNDPVKPGMHSVEVSVSGMAEGNPKTVSVDAKPCMRYYLGAKRDAATGQITAYVTGTEPIKECNTK